MLHRTLHCLYLFFLILTDLASFLLAVSRKSLISLILQGMAVRHRESAWLAPQIIPPILIFRERGREGERERNIPMWETHRLVASQMPPTEALARNPGMCPDWESNWQPFGLQAGAQSSEPHQPGPFILYIPGSLAFFKLFEGMRYFYILKPLPLMFSNWTLSWLSALLH